MKTPYTNHPTSPLWFLVIALLIVLFLSLN